MRRAAFVAALVSVSASLSGIPIAQQGSPLSL